MAWQFKREESTGNFTELPEGKYRVAIKSAEMAISKAGNDMLKLEFVVSGSNSRLWNYITFLDDRPEITNRMLTQLFDSFGIEDGDFNLAGYVGKVGGVNVKHDDEGRAKISYFLSKRQQESLPPWQGEIPVGDYQQLPDDEELPFV